MKPTEFREMTQNNGHYNVQGRSRSPITVCTVLQNCCKGDEPRQWNTPIFGPSRIENPWTARHHIWQEWLRRGYHPHANFGISIPNGGRLYICVKMSSSVSTFYTPLLFSSSSSSSTNFIATQVLQKLQGRGVFAHLYRSHRSADFRVLWLKRRVSVTAASLLGCEQKIVIISTIFRKKTRNSLFPQCKTSIGNNSGFIKDRVVKFAHIRGFSATADRIVWPTSLSRDRKWPHPQFGDDRRETTPWMRHCV